MIELQHDQLRFSFPDLHAEAHCTVSFQRTLRIPDVTQWYGKASPANIHPIRRPLQKVIAPLVYRGSIITGTTSPQ